MHAPTGFGGHCAFRVLVPAIRMPFCTRSKTILHMHAFLSLVSRCTPLLALLRLERLRQPTFRASSATAVLLLTMALGLLRPLLTLLLRKELLRGPRRWRARREVPYSPGRDRSRDRRAQRGAAFPVHDRQAREDRAEHHGLMEVGVAG